MGRTCWMGDTMIFNEEKQRGGGVYRLLSHLFAYLHRTHIVGRRTNVTSCICTSSYRFRIICFRLHADTRIT